MQSNKQKRKQLNERKQILNRNKQWKITKQNTPPPKKKKKKNPKQS